MCGPIDTGLQTALATILHQQAQCLIDSALRPAALEPELEPVILSDSNRVILSGSEEPALSLSKGSLREQDHRKILRPRPQDDNFREPVRPLTSAHGRERAV